ncbi:MAG: sugar ABC transporter permease, partial [Chloroflexi bacterium]|nr:sugar ABC transporter permease [Chloroflexota bacterium]
MLKIDVITPLSHVIKVKPRLIKQTITGYLFILPGIIGITCFLLGPLIYSLWLCLNQWDIVTPPTFVGLENFRVMLFEDKFFWIALAVTAKYTLVAVPLTMAVSLGVAMLLNTNVKGIPVFRTLYYLPSITPAVASLILWRWLLNTDFGLINLMFQSLGLPKVHWLTDPTWVMPALWIMALWSIGPSMIINLAGLQGVPRLLYEAAEIDGASSWQRFWNVTLPMMSPVLFFNLVMGIIGTFQIFTAGYLMTNGGPENSTLFYV